jgi:glyoxylase-like metal-dependent hydrolase (beta-lactamase superfamily II)
MGRLEPLAMLMSALDNRPTRMRFTVLASLLMGLSIGTSAWAEDYTIRSIRDGLYRFTAGSHHAMFWATDDGIVVLDTISNEAAGWLKAELEDRFEQPVRYVVYSHNHFDHIYGGEVFDKLGAIFVAQELARDGSKSDSAHRRSELGGFGHVLAREGSNPSVEASGADEVLGTHSHSQTPASRYLRSTPKAGHTQRGNRCPLSARSGQFARGSRTGCIFAQSNLK